MIDIHTHILPAVDDGAKDTEISLRCLKTLQESGVTDVFLTPHYIPGEYDNTHEKIEEKCRLLRKSASQEGITVNLHSGVELYLTDAGQQDVDYSSYRLGSSDYILVETAMHGFPINLLDNLYQMVRKGYKPILAHPERYIDIIQNPSLAEDLIYRNVYLQANAGSFFGDFGKASTRAVWSMLQKGFIHFVASDYHCQTQNYPLTVFRDMMTTNYPGFPIDLLINQNPAKIIKNEEIEYLNREVLTSFPKTNAESFFQKILKVFSNA
jgi:protein-tyrosine phosphatase